MLVSCGFSRSISEHFCSLIFQNLFTKALYRAPSVNLLNLNEKSHSFKPQQPFRYSSSGHSESKEQSSSAIPYALLASGIAGGLLTYFLITGRDDSNKSIRSEPKPVTYYTGKEKLAEDEEKEEAPTEVAATAAKPESAAEEEADEEAARTSAPPSDESAPEAPAARAFDKHKVLPDIPNFAQYLIVGGGTAAMSAFKAIRASDPNARVLVITEEQYKPYMRPPLSKELWNTDDQSLIDQVKFKQYNGNERSVFFFEDEFYVEPKVLNEQENGGVAVVTSKRVTQVDIQAKTVRLDNNWEITYDKCLIATGGKPRNLPAVEQNWEQLKEHVTLFRNVEDFKRLHAIAKQPNKTIAIVGGGFLGSELACALATVARKNGGQVVQVFPEDGILRRVLPKYLSEWTTQKVREEGVNVVPNVSVSRVQLNDNKVELNLDAANAKNAALKTNWLLADHIVVAVGLEPNVQLATNSGFEIDPRLGGYVVNAELQARNSIWVAGDAACFYDTRLGRRRVEHHDHAVVSGRLAGENMTGAGKPYWHQSMFWSDLGPKIGFEAIGMVDSSLQTVGLFAKADESDTPAAQVNETNETLRSEVPAANLNTEEKGGLKVPQKKDDYGKGVVLYVKNDRIVGALTWNLFKRIPIARQLIQQQEKITDYSEMAKLFKIDATAVEE